MVWAPAASHDLLEIRRYYRRVASAEIADNVVREIDRVTTRIAARPLARRSREDLLPGLRSALARPYVIFFRIRNGDLEIVRVLHERRDAPAALAKDADNE